MHCSRSYWTLYRLLEPHIAIECFVEVKRYWYAPVHLRIARPPGLGAEHADILMGSVRYTPFLVLTHGGTRGGSDDTEADICCRTDDGETAPPWASGLQGVLLWGLGGGRQA